MSKKWFERDLGLWPTDDPETTIRYVNELLEAYREAEGKLKAAEEKLASLWHICNVYDGDYIGACDSVAGLCEDFVNKEAGE